MTLTNEDLLALADRLEAPRRPERNIRMIVYKLTDQKMQTYGGCQWEIGVSRETDGSGDLCGPGWLHYYHDPLLAVLLNPIHACIEDPILWEAEADGPHKDDCGLKGGCTRLTLLRRIDLPQITTEQRIRFAILCAKAVCNEPAWNIWADRWLDGSDRSVEAAEAARAAAEAAAWAAETAAQAATRATRATRAAAETAAQAAAQAAWAAEKATRSTRAAAGTPLDLTAIAREALKGDSDE